MLLFQFGGFQQIIQNMQNMGFFQYLFPFLLALAIIFGVLRFSLKDTLPKSAAGLISIVVAFLVMLYGSWNPQVVAFLANISGYWLMVGCGIIFIVILLGLIGVKPESLWESKEAKWVFVFAIIFIGILIFFGAGGAGVVGIPPYTIGSDFWTILFFIIILVIVMWFMGREGEAAAGGAAGGGGTPR